MTPLINSERADLRWKDLYRIAGIAALISELVILLGIVTYFIWPYAPGQDSAESIFLLLQNNLLGGLISLDLFLFIGNLFSMVLFLALYVSLRTVNESIALLVHCGANRSRVVISSEGCFEREILALRGKISPRNCPRRNDKYLSTYFRRTVLAVVVGLVGVILLIPARPIVEVYNLSSVYVTATSEVEKSRYLAAGTTLLAQFDGIGWFMNTLLGGLSLLTSSLLMLRSKCYSRATAYVGIVTNLVLCAFVIPPIRLFVLFLSLPGYLIWYTILAQRFFRMGRGL